MGPACAPDSGFTVDGKTGTAQKVVNGQYSRSDYNASFVGFAPSRDPAFAIVVVIDSPHGRNLYYGGSVAAPFFSASRTPPCGIRGFPRRSIVASGARGEARRRRERPTSGPAELPALSRSAVPASGSTALFPDLRGLGARDALRMLARLGSRRKLMGAALCRTRASGGQPDRARLRGDAPARRDIDATSRCPRCERAMTAGLLLWGSAGGLARGATGRTALLPADRRPSRHRVEASRTIPGRWRPGGCSWRCAA